MNAINNDTTKSDQNVASTDSQRFSKLETELEKLQKVDEDIDVKDEVMQQIRVDVKSTRRSIWDHPFWNQFFQPVPVRFAFVLFTGIMLGSMLMWFFLGEIPNVNEQQLAGSLTSHPKQEVSYVFRQTSFKMVPYQIDQLLYMNFVCSSETELQATITFSDRDFEIVKSEFLYTHGSSSSSYNQGQVVFSSRGMTGFQLVVKKMNEDLVPLGIQLVSNGSDVYRKEIKFQ